MGNREKGEVTLKSGGTTYTLKLSINQICILEDDMGLTINEIADRLNDTSRFTMGFLRTVFWVAIGGGSDGNDLTKEDAGEIITQCGISLAMEKVGEAFSAAFPDAAEDESKGANPPKAGADGNGHAS